MSRLSQANCFCRRGVGFSCFPRLYNYFYEYNYWPLVMGWPPQGSWVPQQALSPTPNVLCRSEMWMGCTGRWQKWKVKSRRTWWPLCTIPTTLSQVQNGLVLRSSWGPRYSQFTVCQAPSVTVRKSVVFGSSSFCSHNSPTPLSSLFYWVVECHERWMCPQVAACYMKCPEEFYE
jgi:hypothetical protein